MGKTLVQVPDALSAAGRRKVCRAVGVWANHDGSFKLTGMAGADLAETFRDEEEARWRNDRT